MKKVIGLSVSLSMLTVMGCDESSDSSVPSDGLSTNRIFATFQIVSNGGDTVFAEAQLSRDVPPRNITDSTDFVRLSKGDLLWLSAGDDIDSVNFDDNVFAGLVGLEDTHALFEQGIAEQEEYEFLFTTLTINELGDWYSTELKQSADNTYRVSFIRDELSSARNSVVTMPENYSITSPASQQRFSRASDDIMVEWTNADPQSSIELEINITCPNNEFYQYSSVEQVDAGSITVPAGDLDGLGMDGVCSSTLIVRKIRVGQFDPQFIGGAVNAYQIRSLVFISEE